MLHEILFRARHRSSDTRVWGDQAYKGQSHVIKECAPRAQDHTHRRYRYKNEIDELERAKNRTKSSVAFQGGACVSGDEAAIRICEAALPRTEEERAPAVCHLRVGQSVSQSAEIAADGRRIDAGKPLFALTRRETRGECLHQNSSRLATRSIARPG